MNSKQFKQLLVVFALVCGLGLYLVTREKDSWQAGNAAIGGKVFPEFPLNDVAAIRITTDTNRFELGREKEGEIWTVRDRGNYPANFEQIKGLLTKVWELKSVQILPVGPSQLGTMDLLEPGQDGGKGTGILLGFLGPDGKPLHTLLLGKEHMSQGQGASPFGDGGYPDGRYVLPDDRKDTIALVQETFSGVATDPAGWLKKDFIKVEKIKSITVTTTNSWKVYRETPSGDWKLADPKDGEELDSARTGSFNYALSSPSFEDVIINPDRVELGLASPTEIELETFDGFAYEILAGRKEGDDADLFMTFKVTANLPAERTAGEDEKPEDKERLDKEFAENQKKLKEKLAAEKALEKWTYQVSNYTLASLMKQRADLLKKVEIPDTPVPLLEPPPADLQP